MITIKLLDDLTLDNKLWKRDLYVQDIDYIINSNIYEYDIKRAGFNLIQYYELLDDKTIEYLASLQKDEQTRRIGLLRRDDVQLNKELSKAFENMRKKFFIDNKIKDHQVLSIKKDAIFIINKVCEKCSYRNIEFILKNRYTSFHKFNNIEFYYRNTTKDIAIKGINDLKLKNHKDYMLSFLIDIFNSLEVSSNDRTVYKLKKFASLYKTNQLPIEYYRELNSDSLFNLVVDNKNIKADDYIKGFEIDKSHNYIMYILKLIQRFFFI